MRVRACRAGTGLLLATLGLGLTGCSAFQVENLQFTQDKRLVIQSPRKLTTVSVPLTIRWTMKDFDVRRENGSTSKGSGEFAVFVDRAPIHVGDDLASIGADDPRCRGNARCVTSGYLAAHDIYVTTATHLTLPFLPRAPEGSGKEQHEVTIVLLDGTDTRRIESAWYVDFQFPRRP